MFCGHLALKRAGRFSWEDAAFGSFCFRGFFAGGGARMGSGWGGGREVDACDEYGRAGRGGGFQLVSSSSVRSMMSPHGAAFLFTIAMQRLGDPAMRRREAGVGRGELERNG